MKPKHQLGAPVLQNDLPTAITKIQDAATVILFSPQLAEGTTT